MADRAPKESAGGRFSAFGRFVYNSQKGTILGRNGKSWAGIGLFYFVYYCCLAGFFAAALAIFYQLVDDRTPRLFGADSLLKANPALGFRPMPKLDTTLIRFTEDPKTYQPYIDHLESFLKAYQLPQEDTISCPGDNKPRPPAQYNKACEFKLDQLEPCSAAKLFGYEEGKPCVLIKLNRVYEWQPEPYSNKANDTAALPPNIVNIYKDYSVTVECAGENAADQDNIGTVKYLPEGGFAYKYFPYLNQEGYVSPLLMVKFMNPKVQTAIMVECRAYAKNIKYDKIELDGAVHFELMVDFPPNATASQGR